MNDDPYTRKIALEDKLSRRNAVSAQQGLRDLDVRIGALHEIIIAQQQGLAAMGQRLLQLETRLNMQKVQMTGNGPTELAGSHGDNN